MSTHSLRAWGTESSARRHLANTQKPRAAPELPARLAAFQAKLRRLFLVVLLVLLAFSRIEALLASLQPFFLALGAVGGALDQFGTHQLEHRNLGAIALARGQARDPGV